MCVDSFGIIFIYYKNPLEFRRMYKSNYNDQMLFLYIHISRFYTVSKVVSIAIYEGAITLYCEEFI